MQKIRLFIVLSASSFAASAALAAPATPTSARVVDDLARLSDEFGDAATLAAWQRFDAAYGWPDFVKKIDVDASTDGALHVEPYHSAWVRDRIAPFLFREVTGDFDVRARLRVKGAAGDVAGGTWSLAGTTPRCRSA